METESHSTFLMEFHTQQEKFSSPDELISPIKELLEKFIGEVKEVYRRCSDQSVSLVLDCAQKSIATVQLKSSGLILMNIDIGGEDSSAFNQEASKKFETDVKEKLAVVASKTICPIKRGGPLDRFRYLTSSDERLLEYDVDRVVADVHSPFQHIQIFHTINFGNLLVLDDLQNLAESDLVYTETLIQRGKIDYTGKDVLILGAGDGALLWELLKESPNMVTMVEIDETVMKLCSQHLRSACGSALDSTTGPHHRIIVGDCLAELDKLKSENVQFDFVFSDLTDIPLSIKPQNKEWQFLLDVMEKSLSVLKPNGQFLTHGSGVSSVQSLADFELHLKNLKPQVEFKRCQAFVPSFMEDWVFYQVWKLANE
ncbi:spermine synthase-like isoform X1 [Daphnia pulicaria]|uniref:spermine synthase-like isoform X1 n=1 Tax=Daphnia pulicaria TaxID=35523 RepID=UPI001EEAB594|nr:spermine synthase-like isoform X1 [Daphnia pulicaria]